MSRVIDLARALSGSVEAWLIGDAERPWTGAANLYRAARADRSAA